MTDSLTFAYINENVKNMDITDFLDFLESRDEKFDRKKIKEIQKKIDGIYLIDTAHFFDDNKNPAFVLDLGINFYLYYFKLNKYFYFSGKNYILKPEYIKSLNLEKINYNEIYMRPYRGNYILAKTPERIDQLIEERTAISDETQKFLKNRKNGNLGIVFFNLKKEKIYGLNSLSIVLHYKEKKLDVFSFLSFREFKLIIPKDGYKSNLEKYIDENTLYIRIRDYVKGYDVARRYIKREEKLVFLLNFWQNIIGIDLINILESIDQETIYNFQEKSGIIKFKKKNSISKAVEWVSSENKIGLDMNMRLKEDYLYFGDEELKYSNKSIKLKNNQILYYNKNNDGKKIDFEVLNEENAAIIMGRINDKALNEMIDKIENLRRRD
ncbi:MAG: hypothetical protein ACRCZ2_09285 [Fusobacteriaceae bacterium]